MYCSVCQREVEVDDGYCPVCGVGLDSGLAKADSDRVVFQAAPETEVAGSVTQIFTTVARSENKPGGVRPTPVAGTKPRLVGWLVTYSSDPSGQDFRLHEGRNVVGSDPTLCDVTIESPSVSATHAVIMYRDSRFQIRDDDSEGGTRVNGSEIVRRGAFPLAHRDRITVGEVELQLFSAAPGGGRAV